MAKREVTVPDIGGSDGAEVIELLVAVGDEVALEQGLIVLESDKASMEIPSDVAGTVVELRVSEGQELAEGAVIAVIEAAAADDAAASSSASEPATAAAQSPSASHTDTQTPAPAPAPAPAGPEAGSDRTGAPEQGSNEERVIPVPDIGTDDAVDLTEVCVAVGDSVAEGDSLVVLESDKASMEVPAPVAGEILALLVTEGSSVREGDDLVTMRVQTAPVASDAAVAAAAKTDNEPGSDAGDGRMNATPSPSGGQRPMGSPDRGAPAVQPAAADISARAQPEGPDGEQRKVYAGPAVRKLARELGVDLTRVSGTGPRGRLVKEDLHSFVQAALKQRTAGPTVGVAGVPPVPELDFSAFGPVEVTARSKLDKLSAANMHRSWLNVPHVTQFGDADITDLEAFRASLKAEAESRGVRLTPLPFLLKACAVALRDAPKFRSSLAGGGEELVIKQYIHIGMAVDTPAGLFVPVIRDVDQKTLWDLAQEVPDLAARARDRQLKPDEMRGGCFTVSSLGNIGGTGFTPIVNTPEVGILGVSKADMKPVWDGEDFRPRKLLPLCLSYDHRVINGGDAGRFMTHLTALLGDIRRLML